MSKTWFSSDLHLRHGNILTFKDDKGNLIRPGFKDVNHMNEFIIEAHNSVVAPDDKWYCLGDVIMGSSIEAFSILSHMNGRKVLIKGNHDGAKIQRYLAYFSDVRSEIHKKTPDGDKVIFTHRPIRFDAPNKDSNIVDFNVHGHIHQRIIEDKRYINISVEVLSGYKPISWEDLIEETRKRKYN